MARTKFSIVVAVATENNAIGVENRLPWHIPKELAAFRTLTRAEGATNAIIMGRRTYELFPNGPLPGRTNIVLSRNPAFEALPGVIVSCDLGSALKKLGVVTEKVFVIGGAQLYREALLHPQCEAIYLTSVSGAPGIEKVDVFFPDIPGDAYKIDVGYAKSGVVHTEVSPITYEYKRYRKALDEVREARDAIRIASAVDAMYYMISEAYDGVGEMANARASGTGIETLGGLERLANFSLRWDPVGDIVILWRSTSDPTIGFLVFRGMLSAYEWGIDFMYYQVPYEFAVAESGAATPMIHSGFFKAYSSIGASIRRAIVSNGISQLFITGHSLGGALSILAASDLSGLSASGPSAIASAVDVTTFGAPRVGNQAFAAQIHSSRIARILQVRSEDDIVPTTPLSSMVDPARPLGSSLSYEHVGEFVYFRRPQPTIAASHALDNYIGFAMDQ